MSKPFAPVRYFGTGEVARECGVPESVLQDMLRRGKLQQPIKVGNRRLWTQEQLDAAKRVLKRDL